MSLRFTQGEAIPLALTAKNGAGVAHNLTGATFTTYMMGEDGTTVAFDNDKHEIVSAAAGTFTLTLDEEDTASVAAGENKEIVTKITQTSKPVYFRALILTVLPAAPRA